MSEHHFLVEKFAKLLIVDVQLGDFSGQPFSIRIFLCGKMEVDLPTPISHPSSWGSTPSSPPKNVSKNNQFSHENNQIVKWKHYQIFTYFSSIQNR
jgi:hypothetical protein